MSVRNLVKDFETKLSPTAPKASPRIISSASKNALKNETSATSISPQNRFDSNQGGGKGYRILQRDVFSPPSRQRGIYEPTKQKESKCKEVGNAINKSSVQTSDSMVQNSFTNSISFPLDEDESSNDKNEVSNLQTVLLNRLKNEQIQMGRDGKASRRSFTPNYIDEKEAEDTHVTISKNTISKNNNTSDISSPSKLNINKADVGIKRKLLIEGLKQHLNDSKLGSTEGKYESEKSSNEGKGNRCADDSIDRSYQESDTLKSPSLPVHSTNISLEKIDYDLFGNSTRVDVERQEMKLPHRGSEVEGESEHENLDFIENHCSMDSVESIDSLVQHCKYDLSPKIPSRRFLLDNAKLDEDERKNSIDLSPKMPSRNFVLDNAKFDEDERIKSILVTDGCTHPNIRRHRKRNFKIIKSISKTCRSSIVTVRKLVENSYQKMIVFWLHFTSSVVFDISVYVQRIPKAMQITAKCVVEVTQLPSLMSFIGFCVAMFTCIDTAVPRCNPAFCMLMFTHTSSHVDQSKGFYRCTIFLVLLSTIVDIDWLMSDYYPLALDSNIDPFNYSSTKKTLMSVSWYLVLIGSMLKISSLITILFHSPNGRTIIQGVWNKLQVCLPSRRCSSVPGGIESRVIAIVWLELISSISFSLLAVYAQTRLSWAPQFDSPILFTSITNIIYLKAFFGLILVLSILRNTRLSSLCSELNGCFGTSVDHQNDNKVRIDKQFLCFNGVLKLFSSTIGGFLWAWLAFALKLDTNKEIRFVLGAMFATLSATDMISMLNGIVVVCSYFSTKTGIRRDMITHVAEVPRNDDRCVDFDDILLDPSPTALDPGEFSILWKSCSKAESVRYKVSRVPTIQDCVNTFEQNKFHPVAFGLLGNSSVMKIFLFAKSSSTIETSSYLVEIIFDPTTMMVNVQTKATVASSAQAFHYFLFAPLTTLFEIKNPDIISKVNNFHHDK